MPLMEPFAALVKPSQRPYLGRRHKVPAICDVSPA
jgi:hypothetical protein